MDANKKLFRAKLNAQKQAKQRVDSPLVRYNEHDQPVCKVCEVVVKSESLWPAHLVSRKHHEAIGKYRAAAAARSGATDSNPNPPKETRLPKRKERSSTLPSNFYGEPHEKSESSTAMLKNRSSKLPPDFYGESREKSESSTATPKDRSSTLPPNFFDNQEKKRQKKEGSIPAMTQPVEPFVSGSETEKQATSKSVQRDSDIQASKISKVTTNSETKQAKGSLPENFFDDKDSDLRARGITPVKLDPNDQYKEFENSIKENLQEVDDRLEEEEIDTADIVEEAETIEQRTRNEKVEMLKRKHLEFLASKSAARSNGIKAPRKKEPIKEDSSSSDDENSETFVVDWRAKHI